MKNNSDSVYIPMSDLLTGFLFVFIIVLLTLIAMLGYKKELTSRPIDVVHASTIIVHGPITTRSTTIKAFDGSDGNFTLFYADTTTVSTSSRTGNNKVRNYKPQELLEEILLDMQSELAHNFVTVSLDLKNGIARFDGSLFYDLGQHRIKPEGKAVLSVLASVLGSVLACYSSNGVSCEHDKRGKIEAVFLEGHTDSSPLINTAGIIEDNLDLSALRATRAFKELIRNNDRLTTYKNNSTMIVLGVSGYGPTRPIIQDFGRAEPRNRRIDLRFIMETETTNDSN